LRAFQCRFATGGKGATSLRRRVALWKVGSSGGVARSPQLYTPPLPTFEAQQMFIHRYYDYDLRSYPRGFYFNFFGIVRILKFKTNTVMEKDNWIFIIEVLGKEFVIR
jgi:hypothetical protein